ncbi:MAG: hypothetical protein POELPBGB_01319 [Bacteroidia bacterium]|nr:hypothetical protein [Bacteroidia bacterium]
MDTNLTIGVVTGILACGTLASVKQKFIDGIINKYIQGLSTAQVSILFWSICALAFFVPSVIGYGASEKSIQEVHNTTMIKAEKNDIQAAGELAMQTADLTQSIIAAQERKDSIIRASKDKLWVFQIGAQSDLEATAALYEKVKHIGNVNVFELPRRNYFVYQKTGASSKEELEKILPELKAQLSEIETDISIIDLAEECKTRKDVTQDTKGKFQRKHPEISCYTCK